MQSIDEQPQANRTHDIDANLKDKKHKYTPPLVTLLSATNIEGGQEPIVEGSQGHIS